MNRITCLHNRIKYAFVLLLALMLTNDLKAQNIISVPFSNGFVGDNTANNVSSNSLYLSALGWTNVQFTQNSSGFVFVAQGNDIPGTVLITDNLGVQYSIPGFIKWRAPSGNPITTPVFVPTSGATLATNSSNGSATYAITTLSYIGLTFNGQTLIIPTTGNNAGKVSGNAATTGILDALNSYLGSFPTISIIDYSVNENIGTITITFTLSAASSQTVTVNFATLANTATSGADYTAQSGMITFAPGETSKTITLAIINDTAVETNESFYIQLSNAINGAILDPQATITIIDNDVATGTPTISTTGTLTAFSACTGLVSAEQSFTVSGTDLSANLVVTAPTGYQISTTTGTGFA